METGTEHMQDAPAALWSSTYDSVWSERDSSGVTVWPQSRRPSPTHIGVARAATVLAQLVWLQLLSFAWLAGSLLAFIFAGADVGLGAVVGVNPVAVFWLLWVGVTVACCVAIPMPFFVYRRWAVRVGLRTPPRAGAALP